jgi:hypothetical protein
VGSDDSHHTRTKIGQAEEEGSSGSDADSSSEGDSEGTPAKQRKKVPQTHSNTVDISSTGSTSEGSEEEERKPTPNLAQKVPPSNTGAPTQTPQAIKVGTPFQELLKFREAEASKITPGLPIWVSVPQDTRNQVQNQYLEAATPANKAAIMAMDYSVIQAILTGPKSILRRHLDHDQLPLTSFLDRINGIPLVTLQAEADSFFQDTNTATGSPNNEVRGSGGGG